MSIELIFFDVGGVLGTNGWDRDQRAAAVAHFGIDADDFEYRHAAAVAAWEEGRMTLREYLDLTVFSEPRSFSHDEFQQYMYSQSHPSPDAIALARALTPDRSYRMMTLNNESAELNRYRIDTFGIGSMFDAFLTSCYIGVRKPVLQFYARAFGIARVDPTRTVFIDDRPQNLLPARAFGVHTIQWTNSTDVAHQLAELGVVVPQHSNPLL